MLVISASSGLPIDFTIEGPAELNGEVLQLLDTGTVTVVATQDGNDYYQQALPVSQSFLVFTSDTIPVVTNPFYIIRYKLNKNLICSNLYSSSNK